MGFPIRTSPDHCLFAAPRSFSQLATSFIAFLRLGIPTHALSSLTIKSISNTDGGLRPPGSCQLSVVSCQLRLPATSTGNHFALACRILCARQGLLVCINAHPYSVFKERLLLPACANGQMSTVSPELTTDNRPLTTQPPQAAVVGLGRVELPTSPLSGVRSNQLSYRPSGYAGGAGRDRTGGLLSANQALSQLSYSPSSPGAPSSAPFPGVSIEASWMQRP